jgi:hypothetical protein
MHNLTTKWTFLRLNKMVVTDGGSGDVIPLLVKLGTSESGQIKAPEILHLLEDKNVPLEYDSGWAPQQAWRLGRTKKILHLLRV